LIDDAYRPRRAAAAIGVLFFVNGATFSNWLPRVPEIRDRLGLGNAGLGAALLGGGLGGIVGAVLVGRVAARLGSRRLLVVAAALLSVGLPFIAIVPEAVLLLVVLTVLGTLDVFNDVAMNAQGVMVQDRIGRSIMNRLHGMWSLGFTGGAVVGSAAAAAEIGVRLHLAIVGAALLVTVLLVQRWLIPVDAPAPAAGDAETSGSTPDGVAPVRPRAISPVVVLMAISALAAAMLEVTPNDWAAVLMRDELGAGRTAGFGSVACAGAMLVGRLGGDHVLDRIGGHRLLQLALAIIAVGVIVTVTAPVAALGFAGLAIWGLGLSVVFPQLYASAARLPGTSAGAGLGSMLFGQRLGGMLTAAAVGSLAAWYDLRVAFAVVSIVAFALVVIAARRLA
jgi:predicted MFS family arabinose efflux permease